MIDIPHYQTEQFLVGPTGNNAFDFERRSETNPEPTLRVAPLITFPNKKSALQNLGISTYPAFEVFEDNKLKSFAGLKNFLLFPNPIAPTTAPTSPIFIFDNHNHAFYFWHIALHSLHVPVKGKSKSYTLIHIDQHKDSRFPATMLTTEQSADVNELFLYTKETLNVGNFIPPAVKTGLIDQVINIDSSTAVSEALAPGFPSRKKTFHAYILDIDLDFFAPELDYIAKAEKIALIKKLLPSASIVTIATSPFFLDQSKAIALIKEILAN